MSNSNQGQPQPQRLPVQTAAHLRAKKRGGGCWVWFACGCLAIILATSLLGAGGFIAYQSGAISLDTILNLAGLGPADIEFDNFRDETIFIYIKQLDVPSDESPAEDWLEIKPFDVRSYPVLEPGGYLLNFGLSSEGSDLGTCALTVKSGDQYQFVALPERIAVNRLNDPPTIGTDLIVGLSSLCR